MSEEYYEEEAYADEGSYYDERAYHDEGAYEDGYDEDGYDENGYDEEGYYEGGEDGQEDFLENGEIDCEDFDRDDSPDADSELDDTAIQPDKNRPDDQSDLTSLAALAALTGAAAAKHYKGGIARTGNKKRIASNNDAVNAACNPQGREGRQNEIAFYIRFFATLLVFLFIIWAFVTC